MELDMWRLRWRAVPVLIVVLGASALGPALAAPASGSVVGAQRTSASGAARHGHKPPRRRRRVTLHRLSRCPAMAYNYPALPPPGPGFVAEARREARVVIGGLRFPAGTKPVVDAPAGATDLRPSNPCASDPETAGYYEYWVSDRGLQSLIDWVKAHPPAGGALAGTGASGRNGTVTSEFLSFQYAPASEVTDGAQLFVSGSRLPDGRTAIRVDADVSWLVLRPVTEQVPSGVRTIVLTFTTSGQQGQPTTQTVTVTDPNQVEEIEWLTDVLPVQQPSAAPPSCPALISSVDARFEDANGNTVAEANDVGCPGMTFSIDGKSQDPLAPGDYFNVLQTAFDSTSG